MIHLASRGRIAFTHTYRDMCVYSIAVGGVVESFATEIVRIICLCDVCNYARDLVLRTNAARSVKCTRAHTIDIINTPHSEHQNACFATG